MSGPSLALAQKVKVDIDSRAQFATFKTFDWADGHIARNPLVTQIITSSIEDELMRRGLKRDTVSPDVRVSVMAAVGIDMQGVGPSWNNQEYRSWGGYTNPAALMNIPTGTLLIDIVETKDKISVFRGVANHSLPDTPSADTVGDAKKVDKTVRKAIKKVFEKYPVRPSS